MTRQLEVELKVGIFVTIGIALVMVAILVLGSADNLMVRKNHYTVHFSSVEGLIPGAKVVLSGVQIGTAGDITFDEQRKNIKVALNVARGPTEWIRGDSIAEIATQGVLGDKYIMISAGSEGQPTLPDQADIPVRNSANMAQFLTRGDQLMASLNNIAQSLDHLLKTLDAGNRSETLFQGMALTAKNLSLASDKLNHELDGLRLKNLGNILEKINNGTGTIGALVNDPGLYDDVKALMGGVNRNRIMRNLVRQTVKSGEETNAAAAGHVTKSP